MFCLTGKTAVITGAARGIGKITAQSLGECGAAVCLADINESLLKETVVELCAQGIKASYIVMDVARTDSIQDAMAKAASYMGGIDIIVNSAGILGTMSIEEMDKEKEWDKVLEINLSGTFFVAQGALPYLKESKAGRIINISSLTGRNGGFAGSMSYAASKGGVNAITRGMARHLAPHKITVNAICPAATETDILKGYTEEKIAFQTKNILLGRLGKPEEIAAAVCYLASDEAAFVTGIMLDVNGGAYFG